MRGQRRGEGARDRRTGSVALTFTQPRVKQITSRKLLCSAGSSAWCSVMTKTGGMGVWWEGGSRGVGYTYMYS